MSQRQSPKTERQIVTPDDFAAEIQELDGDSESFNFLIYGDPGVGKTVFSGSCSNSLILACEPGYVSAARTPTGVPVTNRKIRRVRDTATALAAIDWLEAGNYRKFDWVIAEGLSTFENRVRLGYAAEAYDANPQKRVHRNLPDKPDYHNTQNFMKGWLARLIDLPVNLLVTAHAMRMEDDDGNRIVLPAFQKKEGELSNFICGLMHVVGYMKKTRNKSKEEVRRLYLRERIDKSTGTRYVAKDNLNALPAFVDNADMPALLGYIQPDKPVETKRKKKGKRNAES